MDTVHRVDPRISAYGKARIEFTRRAQDENEWRSAWREPRYAFPFKFGNSWKQCITYQVADFAAEIGFFIDVLGFPVSAFSTQYAQFTSPGGDFYFGITAVEGYAGTPPESITLQFMLNDLTGAIRELEARGVEFEYKPGPQDAIPALAVLRTPHGVRLELWGPVEAQSLAPIPERADQSELSADFWADDADESGESGSETDAQPDPTSGSGDEEDGEAFQDEPVYVDDEDDPLEESLTIAPPTISPHSRTPFPTTIIRRAEDLLKGGLPVKK